MCCGFGHVVWLLAAQRAAPQCPIPWPRPAFKPVGWWFCHAVMVAWPVKCASLRVGAFAMSGRFAVGSVACEGPAGPRQVIELGRSLQNHGPGIQGVGLPHWRRQVRSCVYGLAFTIGAGLTQPTFARCIDHRGLFFYVETSPAHQISQPTGPSAQR